MVFSSVNDTECSQWRSLAKIMSFTLVLSQRHLPITFIVIKPMAAYFLLIYVASLDQTELKMSVDFIVNLSMIYDDAGNQNMGFNVECACYNVGLVYMFISVMTCLMSDTTLSLL